MAYMNQEMKKELAHSIKAVLKKYGMKGSISIRNHMALVVKVKRNNEVVDLGDTRAVNVYHTDKHYEGVARDFLNELYHAMMVGNHNNSDIMVDYFDVGWYCDIYIVD